MDKKIMMYYPTVYPTTGLPYHPTGAQGLWVYTPSPLCNKRDLICVLGYAMGLVCYSLCNSVAYTYGGLFDNRTDMRYFRGFEAYSVNRRMSSEKPKKSLSLPVYFVCFCVGIFCIAHYIHTSA